MVEEIVASPTAFANGGNEADDKEFAVAFAVEKEETSDRDAAAAYGDRDPKIERLLQACLEVKEYQLAIDSKFSEIDAHLALQKSERVEICRSWNVIDDLIAKMNRMSNEWGQRKAQNIDNAAPAEEEELRSQLVDVKEKSLQNRGMQGGVSGSLTQALALGIASAVGVVAGTLGTLVCLYVAKRK